MMKRPYKKLALVEEVEKVIMVYYCIFCGKRTAARGKVHAKCEADFDQWRYARDLDAYHLHLANLKSNLEYLEKHRDIMASIKERRSSAG